MTLSSRERITDDLDTMDSNGFRIVSENPSILKAAFGGFPSGVAAICAEIEGSPTALVASSFSVGVSLDPPLVLFSVQNISTTWPILKRAERLGVSILGREHDKTCLQLASKKGDRFVGVNTFSTHQGAVLIEGAPVWLDCEVISETPAGDHHLVLLEVKSLRVDSELEPLIYHRAAFRKLAT